MLLSSCVLTNILLQSLSDDYFCGLHVQIKYGECSFVSVGPMYLIHDKLNFGVLISPLHIEQFMNALLEKMFYIIYAHSVYNCHYLYGCFDLPIC